MLIHDFKYSNLSKIAVNGPFASQSQRGIFRLFTFLRHLTSDIIIDEIVHTPESYFVALKRHNQSKSWPHRTNYQSGWLCGVKFSCC